ncbi:Uncharacterised protein [uncultured Blautia sp.]|nr:Uncharacterised protein [uncultured Blautia sp.]
MGIFWRTCNFSLDLYSFALKIRSKVKRGGRKYWIFNSLALNYIKDYEGLMKNVHGWLTKRGFSIFRSIGTITKGRGKQVFSGRE